MADGIEDYPPTLAQGIGQFLDAGLKGPHQELMSQVPQPPGVGAPQEPNMSPAGASGQADAFSNVPSGGANDTPGLMDFLGAAAGPTLEPPPPETIYDKFLASGQRAETPLIKMARDSKRADAEVLTAQGKEDEADRAALKLKGEQDEKAAAIHAEEQSKLFDKIQALQDNLESSMKTAQERTARAQDDWLRAADDFGKTRVHSWWSEASVGARIAGVISELAAGIGNGLAGHPSSETPMDRVINRDLERQKMMIEIKGQNVTNRQNLYQQIRAQGHDELQSMAMVKDVAISSTKAMIEARIAQLGPGQAKENLAAALSQLNAKQGVYRAQTMQAQNDKEMTRALQESGANVQVAQMWKSAVDLQNASVGHQSGLTGVEGDVERLGKENPEVYKKLAAFIPAYRSARSAAKTLQSRLASAEKLIKQEGRQEFNARNNDLVSEFNTNANIYKQLGALSGGDQKQLLALQGLTGTFDMLSSIKDSSNWRKYSGVAKTLKTNILGLENELSRQVGSLKVGGKPLKWSWRVADKQDEEIKREQDEREREAAR